MKMKNKNNNKTENKMALETEREMENGHGHENGSGNGNEAAPETHTAETAAADDISAALIPSPTLKCRVALEPELEEIAAFWPAAKRFEMARKFGRWARQLRVSAFILFHDSHQTAKPSLRYVGPRKARLN